MMRWISTIARPSVFLYALGAVLLLILQLQINAIPNLDAVTLFGVAAALLIAGCFVR